MPNGLARLAGRWTGTSRLWRTPTRGADAFRFAMYNVTPGGAEALAVEAIYRRTQ